MMINREIMSKLTSRLTLLSILIFNSSTSLAGIYKWVDEEGNVHYGQQRPANSPSEKMQVQQHAPRDVSSYNRPGSKQTSEQTDKTGDTEEKPDETTEPEKKPETAAEKKRRLAACAQARKGLTTMESIGRVRSKDKDGNTAYLSQKQKEAKMKQSRDLISKHCK